MKRTIIHAVVAGLCTGLLAACGGSSQDAAASSRLLADGEACNAAWSATANYYGGAQVSRNGRNYTAAYWTLNQDPATNSGPAGSGQPWISGYLCGGAPSPVPAPSPTPTPAPAPTPTPVPSCPQWVAGHTYNAGDKVTNKGGYYQCKVAGWCSSSASAYEPGAGWAWTDAWGSIAASQCGGTSPAPTPAPAPAPAPSPAPAPTPAPTPTPVACDPAWVATKAYFGGNTVSYNHVNYQARFFTQDQNPSTNSGPASSGQPWAPLGACA